MKPLLLDVANHNSFVVLCVLKIQWSYCMTDKLQSAAQGSKTSDFDFQWTSVLPAVFKWSADCTAGNTDVNWKLKWSTCPQNCRLCSVGIIIVKLSEIMYISDSNIWYYNDFLFIEVEINDFLHTKVEIKEFIYELVSYYNTSVRIIELFYVKEAIHIQVFKSFWLNSRVVNVIELCSWDSCLAASANLSIAAPCSLDQNSLYILLSTVPIFTVILSINFRLRLWTQIFVRIIFSYFYFYWIYLCETWYKW